MARVRIKGVANVRAALSRELLKVNRGVRKGLIKAGFIIKADSIRNSPIDLSNLRSSHFVYWRGTSFDTPSYNGGDIGALKQGALQARSELRDVPDIAVRVGASADYALFVHEGNAAFNWNKGGPKFLQRAIASNQGNILTIIANEARIT